LQILFRRKHPGRVNVLSAAFKEMYREWYIQGNEQYFTAEDISWANCVSICTDGAAVLTGHKKGFQAEAQKIGPHVNFIHCIMHREALEPRDLEQELHSVLQEAVKVENFVRARPLNSLLIRSFVWGNAGIPQTFSCIWRWGGYQGVKFLND
jgi:hypothetical protein